MRKPQFQDIIGARRLLKAQEVPTLLDERLTAIEARVHVMELDQILTSKARAIAS